MFQPVEIGLAPWSHAQMQSELERFYALLDARPICNNSGGMQAPHLFAVWFMARALQPAAIVESGVWKGQGTWMLRQACPDAAMHCIEPCQSRIEFRDDRATYHTRDFAAGNWDHLDRERTLLVFDDHVNALHRVREARKLGFRHLIIEDNYPAPRGDCYSLKKAFAGAGFSSPGNGGGSKYKALLAGKWRRRKEVCPNVQPNPDDARYLNRHLDVYSEFPPLFRPSRTRWGDDWTDEHYPTPPALLQEADRVRFPVLWREALSYTWICYARLKR
ncbi:MAG: hypothetical protein AAGA00_09625 [Pseudomonadota bacterium]